MYSSVKSTWWKELPSKKRIPIPEYIPINKWSLYYSLYYKYHKYSIEVKIERLGDFSDKINNEFIRSWIST